MQEKTADKKKIGFALSVRTYGNNDYYLLLDPASTQNVLGHTEENIVF